MSKKRIRNISLVIILFVFIASMTGCSKTAVSPLATITMEDGAKIEIRLYPEKAPNTVANFISLANGKFYDGLTFHRVVDRFIIQGGDPNGDGTGGPGYTIEGEFTANGFKKNDLSHVRGTISMARFGDESNYNTAGSQFFIMVADKDYLDGNYAAFGKIMTGFDVLDEIARTPTKADGETPKTTITIKEIRVNTYDVNYGDPKTIKIDE